MIALWLALALAEEPPSVGTEAPPIAVEAPAPPAAPKPAAPVDDETSATLPAEFGPPGAPPAPEDLDRVARETAMGIRCPSCQGLSVAESPANTAQTMNRRIGALIAAGYSREQVEAYFVSRYGEWVLLDPPIRGMSWLLWVVPVGGIGGVFAWAMVLGLRWREEEAFEGPTEEHMPRDPFEKRILEEIE